MPREARATRPLVVRYHSAKPGVTVEMDQADDNPRPASPSPVNPCDTCHRRRRRILRVALIALATVVVLVALAPTLASTGPGQRAVLAIVNARIVGRVESDGWSLRWFGSQRIDSLRVMDGSTRVAEVRDLKVPVSLARLAIGGRDIGAASADAATLDVRILPDGRTNLARAVSPRVPKAHKPRTAPKRPATPWQGSIRVACLSGALADGPLDEPIALAGSLSATFSGNRVAGEFSQTASINRAAVAQLAGRVAVDSIARWRESGEIALTGWANLAAIATSQPALARRAGLHKDLRLTSGMLTFDHATAAIRDGMLRFDGRIATDEIAGWRGHQRVTFSPATLVGEAELSADRVRFPGPGLRLSAEWAEVKATGEPGSLRVQTLRPIDLELLFVQLMQFIDMGDYYVGGSASVSADSSTSADGSLGTRAQVDIHNLHVWRGGEGLLHDRNIRIALAGSSRPGGGLTLARVDIDAADSGLLWLRARGQYEPGRSATVSLDGQYRVNIEPIRALLGRRWPADLEAVSTSQPATFSACLPLRDPKRPARSPLDVLRRDSDVKATAAWKQIDYRGLQIGPPSEPLPVRYAGAKLSLGPGSAPANGGTLAIRGILDLSGPVVWLDLMPPDGGQPAEILTGVRINDAMSARLMPSLNPIFPGARRVDGTIDLTLSDLHMPLRRPTFESLDSGARAAGEFRARQLRVQGGLLAEVGSLLGLLLTGKHASLDQPIRFANGRLEFANATIRVAGTELVFNGWLAMMDDHLARRLKQDTLRMTITVKLTPTAARSVLSGLLLGPLGLRGDLLDLPITVPLHGTRRHYKLDKEEFLRELLKNARQPLSKESTNLLRGLFGLGKRKAK